MLTLKTRTFHRWQKKTRVPDATLQAVLLEIQAGLIDADLGGGVVKKRVPIEGRGKSGGARTIIATNNADRWIFVFGFEKNQRSNITPTELEALQLLAASLLSMSQQELQAAINDGTLTEIQG